MSFLRFVILVFTKNPILMTNKKRAKIQIVETVKIPRNANVERPRNIYKMG